MIILFTVLPHHRTYGSVYGGSLVFTNYQIIVKHGRISQLGYYFLGKDLVQDFRHSPISFSTTSKFLCFPMFHSQCFQHSILCFNFLPLFPIDCSYPTPCPFVRCFKKSFHICKSKVFYPCLLYTSLPLSL